MKTKLLIAALLLIAASAARVLAQPAPAGRAAAGVTNPATLPFVDLNVRAAANPREVALSVQLLLLLTVLTLAPSILVLTTAFLRIAIVFDFVKRALSLQQVPPTQVLLGVALFLTLFVMFPTLQDIYSNAFAPFAREQIGISELFQRTEAPLRLFMARQMGRDFNNVRLFMTMRGLPKPATLADVPTYVLIPSFVLHELAVSFKIGVLLFIPFIVIDMVVASTLMSMGMIMLPPVMISLPFKLVLFVLVDGWGLITMQLVRSFH